MLRISVIICSHNRLRYLPGSVESLARQTIAPSEFEVILVDNASTDGTAEWAKQIQATTPNLVYLLESKLGLSHARNAGWRAARSEVVAFLDDDAVAAPNWLEKILEKFAHYDSRMVGLGGKIDPLWESPAPDWLSPNLWRCLTVLDLSPDDMVLENQTFYGANMAFRKSALAEIDGFHSGLGRKGNSLLSNEESHLKRRLDAKGYYSIYSPEVVVAHTVTKDRMTKEWFRNRYYWQGVSDALMDDSTHRVKHGPVSWLKVMLQNAIASLRLMRSRLRFGSKDWQRPEAAGKFEFPWYHRYGYIMTQWRLLFGKGRIDAP